VKLTEKEKRILERLPNELRMLYHDIDNAREQMAEAVRNGEIDEWLYKRWVVLVVRKFFE